ncbi:MAG TPA: hypothetical protein VFC47_11365 [Caulobacteraceae bacterium]|nr:hypothetical protein [Caulobacteraceae bacterium]
MTDWIPLAPRPKFGGRYLDVMASMQIVRGVGASPLSSAHLFIAKELGQTFVRGARVSASVDARDGATRLRLELDAAGPFTLCKSTSAGGTKLFLPSFPPLPAEARRTPMAIVERSDTVVILSLPTTWNTAPAKPRGAAPARAAPAARQPAPAANPADAPIDVNAYLARFQRKASRLAAGRWALDGETVSESAILLLGNRHRTRSGLGNAKLSQMR